MCNAKDYLFPSTELISTSEVRSFFPKQSRPAPATIIRWSRRGNFPPVTVLSSRKFFWNREQVLAWFHEKSLSPVREQEGA